MNEEITQRLAKIEDKLANGLGDGTVAEARALANRMGQIFDRLGSLDRKLDALNRKIDAVML